MRSSIFKFSNTTQRHQQVFPRQAQNAQRVIPIIHKARQQLGQQVGPRRVILFQQRQHLVVPHKRQRRQPFLRWGQRDRQEVGVSQGMLAVQVRAQPCVQRRQQHIQMHGHFVSLHHHPRQQIGPRLNLHKGEAPP